MTDRIRLLVVDDVVVDRLALRRAVEHSDLDAELVETSTASEALQVIGERFDCVLLDHELPDIRGTELARRLREAGDLTPVILVTGAHDDDLLQEAVDAGITDFFPKSDVSPRRIGLRVRFALRMGRGEAASRVSGSRVWRPSRCRAPPLSLTPKRPVLSRRGAAAP